MPSQADEHKQKTYQCHIQIKILRKAGAYSADHFVLGGAGQFFVIFHTQICSVFKRQYYNTSENIIKETSFLGERLTFAQK
jgi:hypothetical protein